MVQFLFDCFFKPGFIKQNRVVSLWGIILIQGGLSGVTDAAHFSDGAFDPMKIKKRRSSITGFHFFSLTHACLVPYRIKQSFRQKKTPGRRSIDQSGPMSLCFDIQRVSMLWIIYNVGGAMNTLISRQTAANALARRNSIGSPSVSIITLV
jgi:hypothetical protein